MNKKDLYNYFINSKMFTQWHWYQWHFNHWKHNKQETPFTKSLIEALLSCENKIPSYSKNMIDHIASISGREKDERQYEQLLQVLSEILIINKLISSFSDNTYQFDWEPTSGSSKKNPEITITNGEKKIGIEVKAPSLLKHEKNRAKNPTQIASRFTDASNLKNFTKGKKFTAPRDNPIKDFLLSANEKFESFKQNNQNFKGLLVIVWDDHIYEPISTLLHEASGLFTSNSFARDSNGEIMKFENVDGVIIVRHLHQFRLALRNDPLIDGKNHAMDYGQLNSFPPKAFISNPYGTGTPEAIVESLQAFTPSEEMGTEYTPKELVWWI